ncbi:MAG: CPBP family intramembrane metalloprotease [Bacteroidetes bacterium]|nr:CPBP family intramembrane metalloprotease [Bacteroidota bacterium]
MSNPISKMMTTLYTTPSGVRPLWHVIVVPLAHLILFFLSYTLVTMVIYGGWKSLPDFIQNYGYLRDGIELTAAILSSLGAIYTVFIFWKKYSWSQSPIIDSAWLKELFLGVLIGAGILSLVIGIMALLGFYRIDHFIWENDYPIAPFLIGNLLSFLAVGISEEVLFRAGFFHLIEDYWGSWAALAISSLFFGLVHLGNPEATLFGAVAITIEAGILLGAAYMITRKLWLVIGIHWAWNFFQGPVFGCIISGSSSTQTGLIQPIVTGPDLLTGGQFGPEGGLIAVVVATGTGIYFLIKAINQGKVVAGPAKAGENGEL